MHQDHSASPDPRLFPSQTILYQGLGLCGSAPHMYDGVHARSGMEGKFWGDEEWKGKYVLFEGGVGRGLVDGR